MHCCSTVSLLVMLTDVNDNAPMFAGNRQDNDDNFIVQILEVYLSHTLVLSFEFHWIIGYQPTHSGGYWC